MAESKFQNHVIRRLEREFPGCVVLKNDSSYRQGIPDLTVLFPGGFWAWLEVKTSGDADVQPNQEYYVNLAGAMSFGAFIYPSNEEEVFRALQHALFSTGH